MNGQSFDVAILGGGPGGYPAAIRAAQYGLKVVVIEKYKVGGTCVHWGCIPTKAILESAEVYSIAKRGQEFGVGTGSVTLDYAQVSKRRDRIVTTSTGGIEYLFKKHSITLVTGEGKLTSPTTISVTRSEGGTAEISAKDVIIATGSIPKGLPGVTIDGERIINSDHASTMAELPGSVIIVGAGAIGAEFASAWNDMGTQVTLVEMLPRVLPLEDAEIGDELAMLFSRRGIKVMAGAGVKLDSIQTFPDRVELDVEQNGSTQRLSAERLLIATGRAPATSDIGLESLGVKIERGFIQVDELMRTAVPHLYAIGDAVGGLMLAHKATAEGLLAAATIAGKEVHPLDYRRIPSCTYCRPQVASVGWREAEAKEAGRNVKIGKFPFMASGMARVIGERDGFVKIVADEESMEILGVHILGPRATELIAEPALARLLEATPEEIALNVHPHPTLSEAVMEAAEAVEGIAISFA